MNEPQYKVSVIIPIYNVEKYIAKCAHSLFSQELDTIEYIFVDDCSPDNSINILKEIIQLYPTRQKDIYIIRNEQNMGLPKAREIGIGHARGEYIAHCDGDDWIDRRMYLDMYETALSFEADIVACDDIEYYSIKQQYRYRMFPYTINTIIDSNVSTWIGRWSLVCKLIKSSLYRQAFFTPADNNGEDMAFFCQLVHFSNKNVYIPRAYYYANKENHSITRVRSEKQELELFRQLCKNVVTVERFYTNYSNIDNKSILKLKLYAKNYILSARQIENRFELWNSAFPELSYLIFKSNYFSLKDKIKYILTKLRLYPLR